MLLKSILIYKWWRVRRRCEGGEEVWKCGGVEEGKRCGGVEERGVEEGRRCGGWKKNKYVSKM